LFKVAAWFDNSSRLAVISSTAALIFSTDFVCSIVLFLVSSIEEISFSKFLFANSVTSLDLYSYL
jgi:multisubunit Na+/H+ antiporter MnhF subunit